MQWMNLTAALLMMMLSIPKLESNQQPKLIETVQEVKEEIDKVAASYKINSEKLKQLAKCESTFNPKAINGKYGGLFQFDTSTWKSIRKEMNRDSNPDLRFEAKEAIETTAYALAQGKDRLWSQCLVIN